MNILISKYFSSTSLFILSIGLFAQIPQRPNQYTSDSLRTGEWVIMYDSAYKNVVDDPDLAKYYCLATMKEGKPIGFVECFYKSGIKQHKGRFISLEPEIKHGKGIFYHENGNVKQEVYFENDSLYGIFREFHSNGILASEGEMFKNKPIGIWEHFHENGQLRSRGSYKNGKEDGLWELYHPNGQVSAKGKWGEGLQQGYWEFFYESGQLSSKGILVDSKWEGEWIFYHPNGQIKEIGVYSNDKINGPFKDFFESGIQDQSGSYVNDTPHGYFLFHHENGEKHSEGSYVNGVKEGNWKYYHSNGKLESEGPFVNGKNNGHWKYYSEDGVLDSECDLSDGLWNGLAKFYHENGKIKAIGEYRNDERQGEWKYFTESGIQTGTTTFVDEIRNGFFEVFTSNGMLIQRGNLLNDKKDGEWIFNYENGNPSTIGTYKEDYGHGDFVMYHSNGEIKEEGHMVDGNKEGYWRFYNESGVLTSEGNYLLGRRTGKWNYYYQEGPLYATGLYEDGNTVGEWEYYYPNQQLKKVGVEIGDKANGIWIYYSNQGRIESQGPWKMGKKHGAWTFYDSLGAISAIDQYYLDNLQSFGNLYDSAVVTFENRDFELAARIIDKAKSVFKTDYDPKGLKLADVYSLEAKYYLAQKNYKKARKLYKKALIHILKFKSDTSGWYTSFLTGLGHTYYNEGRYYESSKIYGKVLDLMKQRPVFNSGDYSNGVRNLTNSLKGDNKPMEALRILEEEQEFRMKQESGQEKFIANNYSSMINYTYAMDSIKYCMELVDSLISFSKRNDLTDYWTYPEAVYHKASLYHDAGQSDSATYYFQKTIDAYHATGDSTSNYFVYSLMSVGDTYYFKSDYKSSLGYYQRALKICEKDGMQDQWVYPLIIRSMANQMNAQDDIDQALEYSRKLLEIELAAEEPNLTNWSQANLGIALSLGQKGIKYYDEAETYYKEAIRIVENTGAFNSFYVNANQIYVGFLIKQRGEYEKAIDISKKMQAYLLAEESPYLRYLSFNYQNLGSGYYELQQFDSSLINYERAVQLLSQDPNINLQCYQESLRDIANIYEDKEDYQTAQTYNFRALEAIEKYLNKENSYYSYTLAEIADNFSLQKNYSASISYYQQSLEIREKLFSVRDNSYLFTTVSLANDMNENGQTTESLELLEMVKVDYEANGAELSSGYIRCLGHIANIYADQGRVDEAEEIHIQNVRLAKRVFGEEHDQYARYLRNLGSFYSGQGQYDLAYNYVKSALDQVERMFGESLRYAYYAESLSWIHFNREEYVQAVEFRQKAAEIYLREMGETDEYINALYDLGRIYRSMGQYQKAIDTFENLQALLIKLDGSFSFRMTYPINELGTTYYRWKKMDQAFNQFVRLEGLYDSLGAGIWNYANLHNRFGMIKLEQGKLAEGIKHYEQAIHLADSLWGSASTSSLIYKNNLAFGYLYSGDYEKAEELWLLAGEELNEKSDGDLSRVKWMDNMAGLYTIWNKLDKAGTYWDQVFEILLNRITRDFPRLSEHGKAAFWDANKSNFEIFNTYAIKATQEGNDRVVGQMYDYQLQTKSILLSTSTKERRRIMNSGDSTMINTYRRYVNLKEDLAKYYGYSKEQLQEEKVAVSELENQAVRLEKVLSLDAEGLSNEEEARTIRWKSIQRQLKEGEAAVELVRFRHFDGRLTDSVLYAAIVLTSKTKSKPKLVVLTNGNELEGKHIKAYKSSIKFKLRDQKSYAQFWEVIDNELSEAKRVYISPDGVFNQLNIATLLKPDGRYVGDIYDIRLLTSTRDILLIDRERKRNVVGTAYLFGYPTYDLAHSEIEDLLIERGISRSRQAERALDLSRFGFSELPGTKSETEEITKILEEKKWEANLYLAGRALEEELKSISSPSVLHIATHGFFLDDVKEDDSRELGVRTDVSRKNPLLRSGLLLTGAAQTARGENNPSIENGIFTAYEAMNLDLNNTELVILSACETGRGEIKNGEGVYGLQRAFQIAGAEAIVMSLWKVDDSATQLLMTSFYEHWLNGNSKSEALRLAQNQVKTEYPHPYYWGAFVLIGN